MTDSSKKQLSKNIISLSVVQIATYVLPLISVPIVSRIIGPEKFGIINFAAAFVAYFTLCINYSFDFTATRRIAKSPDNQDNRNKVFSEVFFTQVLLLIFCSVIFVIMLFVLPILRQNMAVVCYSFLVSFAALFTQNWMFQAMQDLSKVAIFNLVSRLLFTISILLIVKTNEDFIWQPILIGCIQTLVAIWSFIWVIRKYRIEFIKVTLSRCFKVLVEERIIFFSLIVVNLYTSTNIFILGLYHDPQQVGFYTAGQRLILILQSVITLPLSQAFYPFIGKAFGEGYENGIGIVQKIFPFILLYTGLVVMFTFLIGPYVISLFYGEKFHPAIQVFRILAFIPFISAASNILGINVMLNLGMDKAFFRVTTLGAVFSIVMNVFFVGKWGFLETAVNWLLTEIFILIMLHLVLRRSGIDAINRNCFKYKEMLRNLQPLLKS